VLCGVRWVDLLSSELRVGKERNARAAGGAPIIACELGVCVVDNVRSTHGARATVPLRDVTFVDGASDAVRDSTRYIGALRTRRAAMHLWSTTGGAEVSSSMTCSMQPSTR
jgi:hypothetical protein